MHVHMRYTKQRIAVLTPVFPAASICLSPCRMQAPQSSKRPIILTKSPLLFLLFTLPTLLLLFLLFKKPSFINFLISMAAPPLPPWLSSPSVTLTLSSSTTPSPLPQIEKGAAFDLAECCRDLEENHSALAAHKKEATWHLRRVEQQLEAEKACRRREAMEEVEAKVSKLREEQSLALERIDAEYKEQLMVLRRDAEAKEQKLVEQWALKHAKVRRLMEQIGCSRRS